MKSELRAYIFCLVVIAAGVGFFTLIVRPARGAELQLPEYIVCGAARCDGYISKFGQYSLKYYERRWKRMCAGSARYDAMREANDMGRPMPCR